MLATPLAALGSVAWHVSIARDYSLTVASAIPQSWIPEILTKGPSTGLTWSPVEKIFLVKQPKPNRFWKFARQPTHKHTLQSIPKSEPRAARWGLVARLRRGAVGPAALCTTVAGTAPERTGAKFRRWRVRNCGFCILEDAYQRKFAVLPSPLRLVPQILNDGCIWAGPEESSPVLD